MKIILLGATGQVGSELFGELKKIPGATVTGTSRRNIPGYLQFDPFASDWNILGKADVLVNSIGQILETPGMSFEKIHVGLTERILNARKGMGFPRVIQVSVLGAKPGHPAAFIRTKGIADEMLLQSPDTCVIRPSIVCSHRTMIVRKFLMMYRMSRWTGGVLFLPAGFKSCKIQPVMSEDLAAVVSRLVQADPLPSILNVTGPEQLPFFRILDILFEVKRKKYRIAEVPKWITDVFVKYIADRFFPLLINYQQYQLLFSDNVADNTEAGRLLGRPLTSTIDFWKQEFA